MQLSISNCLIYQFQSSPQSDTFEGYDFSRLQAFTHFFSPPEVKSYRFTIFHKSGFIINDNDVIEIENFNLVILRQTFFEGVNHG